MLLTFPKPLHLFPFLLWPGHTFAVKSLLHALEMLSIMEMVLTIFNEGVPIWFRKKYQYCVYSCWNSVTLVIGL